MVSAHSQENELQGNVHSVADFERAPEQHLIPACQGLQGEAGFLYLSQVDRETGV